MLSQESKQKVIEIVPRVTEDFESFFLKQPVIMFMNDGLGLDFEMKEEYQRSVDLPLFEDIMERYMEALDFEFRQHDVPLRWWGCSSTDMEWVEK